MEKNRKIEMVVRKVTFAEAEELEIEYYASNDWKQSAATVEKMRRNIWSDNYQQKADRTVGMLTRLNDDRDDIE